MSELKRYTGSITEHPSGSLVLVSDYAALQAAAAQLRHDHGSLQAKNAGLQSFVLHLSTLVDELRAEVERLQSMKDFGAGSALAKVAECEALKRELAHAQSWRESTLQTINSMRAMICGIGVVGTIDGMEVIRRLSAIDIVDRHRLNIEQRSVLPTSSEYQPLDADGRPVPPLEDEQWRPIATAPRGVRVMTRRKNGGGVLEEPATYEKRGVSTGWHSPSGWVLLNVTEWKPLQTGGKHGQV